MSLLFGNDRRGQYPDSWYAATARPLPVAEPLRGHLTCDVCIVGGGYTGLSTALHLARQGASVLLLEAHRVGFGASGRNGGQLGSGQRLDQGTLERMVGPEAARRLWDLSQDAKELVGELIVRHRIDAALKPGIAHACRTRAALDHEWAEAERLHRLYGYDKLEGFDGPGIAALTGSERFVGGTLDHGAGHLHPLRFALGLARAALKAGVRIHENTLVTGVEEGTQPLVRTEAGKVRAKAVVLAGNGYLGGLDGRVAARVMPINNFIVATEPLDDFPEILPSDVAVADSNFVVNYWRRSEDNRLLFGGGESYGYRFPRDIAALVRRPMLTIYPQLADARIDCAWGGTLAITMRRMPYFAQPRPGIWAAGGYSGHGVGMAVLAGRILSEAIGGKTGDFDLMASVKQPAFPGGVALRMPLLALAMTWYSLRDRLGL
ncbi:NAD(P)/FAD-dependent oxidoreductase [Frigidibacter sp. ROC022]|uniref:NAD(P)/FAD-dependent oxidoreductase n=1 Tax=Frigidibacter sp. ROC022 TaxID=2971796 RepID=UPI00215B117B|nr:FAD-binding oxidoreductase [Frigidibacter sp. ROC022]MCR8723062.1 FAD-binding oxidoreductase [Frigidibacter sp. ROC022]